MTDTPQDQPTEPVPTSTDDASPTPPAPDATEPLPTAASAVTGRPPVRSPDGTTGRRGVLVPLWALLIVGGLLVFLLGGAIGYAIGDDRDDHHDRFDAREEFRQGAGRLFGPNGPFGGEFGPRRGRPGGGGGALRPSVPRDEAPSAPRPDTPAPSDSGAFLGVVVADSSDPTGAELVRVAPRSPAARAGLERGDVVTEVDGTSVRDASALTEAIRSRDVGDEVEITYSRDDSRQTVTVTLGTRSPALTQ